MVITSGQSLINLVDKDNLSHFVSLKDCLIQANKICGCQKQRKINKAQECDKIYVNIVNNVLPTLLDYLRTKTIDNDIIFYHHGHHEIKRIKLR
jgi:hypothetical protein